MTVSYLLKDGRHLVRSDIVEHRSTRFVLSPGPGVCGTREWRAISPAQPFQIEEESHATRANHTDREKIPSAVMDALIGYPWPGNVREL